MQKGIRLVGWIAVLFWAASGCTGTQIDAPDSVGQKLSTPPVVVEASASPLQTLTLNSSDLTETPVALAPEPQFEPALVWIPSGEFEMGSDPQVGYQVCIESRAGCSLEDFLDEAPKHTVFLKGYWIYTYEVTNEQYRMCVAEKGCTEPAFTEFYNNPSYSDHPVVYVGWQAASQFCQWAGGRLPTEAEWEMAALGNTGWIFPWGDEPDCTKANFSGCTFGEVTLPVGSYPLGASVFGVMDLAGNAAEWVADWYDPEYYAVSPVTNPAGPEDGELKAARGGSWKNPAVGVRSSNRGANYPEVYGSGVGFRCIVDGD